MTRERWMALFFATGSLCFFVGPFPGYASLVGASAAAATFFAGSILFTVGGALQTWLARGGGPGAAWWTATIQSAGTLFFNVTTYQALDTALSNPDYDRLVWRPDALGSICFLVSGAIAYGALVPARMATGPGASGMVGAGASTCWAASSSASRLSPGTSCPSTGSMLDLAAANWNTAAGAACFEACALATLRTGRTTKSPRPRRLRELEHAVVRDVEHDVERIV